MAIANIKSYWSGGDLTFYPVSATDDVTINLGGDDVGVNLKLFGATSGVYALWDQSADTWVRDGGTVFYSFVASGDGGAVASGDGMDSNPESGTEAGYLNISVAGTTYQIPFYGTGTGAST